MIRISMLDLWGESLYPGHNYSRCQRSFRLLPNAHFSEPSSSEDLMMRSRSSIPFHSCLTCHTDDATRPMHSPNIGATIRSLLGWIHPTFPSSALALNAT